AAGGGGGVTRPGGGPRAPFVAAGGLCGGGGGGGPRGPPPSVSPRRPGPRPPPARGGRGGGAGAPAWRAWGGPRARRGVACRRLAVPGFGDPAARVLIVGLAPAAHGGNRTGRIFTGDESGNWLYAGLHRAGFANQPTSVHRDDGLVLRGAWVTAAARCAPPANRPTREELETCRRWLLGELALLDRLRVVVVLGRVAHDAFLAAETARGRTVPRPRPAFVHGAEHRLPSGLVLLCSYPPSQQNTFTGKLTRP